MPATRTKKLPDELVGRYALYKRGTRKLVTWLTTTASQVCDLSDHIKSLKASKQSSTAKKPAASAELEIRAVELVKLAEVICSSPAADVPDDIVSITEDVIQGRESCAAWFGMQALRAGSRLEKENQSHQFFIMILKKIVDILTKAREKLFASAAAGEQHPSPKNGKDGAKTTEGALYNLFALLEIEEAGPNPLGSEPMPKPKVTAFKLENEDDNCAFATWCALQDMADIREYVKQTWNEYKQGDLSFMAASLVTDTAFGLFRHAEEDYAKTSPTRSTEWCEMIRYLGLDTFCYGDSIYMRPDPARQTAEPRLPDSKINIVELLCPIAYVTLEEFAQKVSEACKAKPPAPTPITIATHVGRKLRLHAFGECLMGMVSELEGWHHDAKNRLQVFDGFTEGLLDIHRTGNIGLAMVAACQVYLDIYDSLRTEHVSDGVQQIVACSDTIRQLQHDTTALGAGSSNSREAKSVVRMGSLLSMYDEDFISKMHFCKAHEDPESWRKTSKQGSTDFEGFLPIFAGTELADIKLRIYDVSTAVANADTVILSTAHLYKSLRAEGSLKCDWQDMNLVVSALGKKDLLLPPPSKKYDPVQACRHYLLALGCRIQNVSLDAACDRRTLKLERPSRTVTPSSPLLQALHDRAILNYNHSAKHARSEILTTVLNALATEDERVKSGQKTSAAKPNLQKYTPVQLLTAFKSRLTQDEQFINFDFAGFAHSCRDLLADVASTLGMDMVPDHRTTAGFYRPVVAKVIGGVGNNVMTKKVADILSMHIQTASIVFSKKAFDQTSGRIPAALRPDFSNTPVSPFERMLRHQYGGPDTIYSISGLVAAVYHPSFKPDLQCCCDNPNCAWHGQSSDPTLNNDEWRSKHAGDVYTPAGVMDEIRRQLKTDVELTAQLYHDCAYVTAKKLKPGDMTDAVWRRTLQSMTGMDAQRVDPKRSEDGLMWAYKNPLMHGSHKAEFAEFHQRKFDEWCNRMAQRGPGKAPFRILVGMGDTIPMSAYISEELKGKDVDLSFW